MHNNRNNFKPKSFDKFNLFGINLDRNNSCTTKGTTFYFNLQSMSKVCKVEL